MSLDSKYNVVCSNYSHESGARQRIATGGGKKPGLEWVGWVPPPRAGLNLIQTKASWKIRIGQEPKVS